MAIKNFWHDVADTFYEISFKIQRIKNFVVHKITWRSLLLEQYILHLITNNKTEFSGIYTRNCTKFIKIHKYNCRRTRRNAYRLKKIEKNNKKERKRKITKHWRTKKVSKLNWYFHLFITWRNIDDDCIWVDRKGGKGKYFIFEWSTVDPKNLGVS